jgi:ribosomal protein S18 acetylase RimI-like enzyme
VTVKRLVASDRLDDAMALLIAFFREEGFDTPEDTIRANVATMAGLETCGLFIAGTEGVATVSLEFGIEYGWSAEMGDLYVVPAARGKGVAKALVAAVEAFLAEKDAAGYQVTVAPHAADQGVAGLYRKLGFGNEGRVILYKSLKH